MWPHILTFSLFQYICQRWYYEGKKISASRKMKQNELWLYFIRDDPPWIKIMLYNGLFAAAKLIFYYCFLELLFFHSETRFFHRVLSNTNSGVCSLLERQSSVGNRRWAFWESSSLNIFDTVLKMSFWVYCCWVLFCLLCFCFLVLRQGPMKPGRPLTQSSFCLLPPLLLCVITGMCHQVQLCFTFNFKYFLTVTPSYTHVLEVFFFIAVVQFVKSSHT